MSEETKLNKEFFRKLTVLYVEDDSLVRKNLIKYFSHIFKDTIIAEDGACGLEAYLKNKDKIDVVITDINMPRMNGLEMIDEIKKNDSKIPCIITTAYSDSHYLLDSLNMGVRHYIMKPFEIHDLLKEVEKSYLSNYCIQNLKKRDKELKKISESFDSLDDEDMKDKEYSEKLVIFKDIIRLLEQR